MVRMITGDAFTHFYLLLVGMFLVAALCTRYKGPARTAGDGQGVDRPNARFQRVDDRVRVRPPGPHAGHRDVRGFDAAALELYARRFEEAIESLRLRNMGVRGREPK